MVGLERMRLQGVKYDPSMYEAVRGSKVINDGLESRTLTKEKKFQLDIEQKHFNNWSCLEMNRAAS